MRAHIVSRILRGVYFGTLGAMTAVGVWGALPIIEQQRAARATPLVIHVYSHPFLPLFKDTPLGQGMSTVNNFFAPEVFENAMTAFAKEKPAPFAKGADGEAWQRDLASSFRTHVNDFVSRKYIDSLERIAVTNEAKGVVMVRIENVGIAPIEEIRLEVNGGQMFMEGPAAAAKLRSLGTRAMRVGTLAPGAKAEFFAMTTLDLSPGAEGPRVKVTAKDLMFPITAHAPDAPLRPTLREAGWIAFGTIYLALILAGLGVKLLSLMGVRFNVATAGGEKASPGAGNAPAFPAPAPLTAAEMKAWQRPG